MPTILMLDVTQDDIDTGTPGDERHCAIAQALRRETGLNSIEVLSSEEVLAWGETPEGFKSRSFRATAAKTFEKFIERFDEGIAVKPRTFRLREVA